MFTETDLREALQHSADRADHGDDVDGFDPADPARRRRSWGLPLAAAASVAALAVGVVAFVGGPADEPPPVGSPEPRRAVELVDRAVAGGDAEYGFKDASIRATAGQTIRSTPGTNGTDGTVSVAILPATFVDENQVERGKKVSIAGTTGWFAERTLYELDGQEGARPGQDDPLPLWTIAFRTPAGDWAFASIDSVVPSSRGEGTYDTITIDDPARIVAGFDRLHIRFVRDSATQPLQFATLPGGYRLTRASMTVTRGRVTDESLTFTRGNHSFVVTWTVDRNSVTGTEGCGVPVRPQQSPVVCFSAMRSVVGGTLAIVGAQRVVPNQDADKSAYAAQQKRVLDGITVATDPADYVSFERAVTP